MEKLIRDFFWKTVNKGGCPHPIRWEVVTKSVKLGGIGLGNLSNKNYALLANGDGDL